MCKKLNLLIFFLFFTLFSFGQKQFCQMKDYEYSDCKELHIDAESDTAFLKSVQWNKFKQLKKVRIQYFTNSCATLKGLDKGTFTELSIADSDIIAFFSKNKVPNSLRKLKIWLKDTYGDTIIVPLEIAKLKSLNYFSIGCCANLIFSKCDLSKLKKLDTLIVEGPVSNLKFLDGLDRLKYLGFWSPQFKDSLKVLFSLLPNTKMEAWCFPGDQLIRLWNGENKRIQELEIGDSIVSYDFNTEKLYPSVVEKIETHKKEHYLLGKIQPNNFLASTFNFPLAPTESIVRATINHPIPTPNGIFPFGMLQSGMKYYFIHSNGTLKTKTIETLHYEISNEPVYNLKTSADNYFVGNILFMEK